jgi:hypothetical protein
MDSAPTPQRTERLQVLVPPGEIAAIDAFRFQARMPSRAAAVRELLRRGLDSKSAEDSSSVDPSSPPS